jgi:PKD repeat protein
VPLQVAFDGSASSDSDGSIASHAWNFGDSTTGSGATATHTYTAVGTYTATLTVTDNNGATAARTATITVQAVPNANPTASFTATPTSGKAPLQVAFDGSASSDTDGTIASYQWDFGDSSTGTGATVQHTYNAVGTYTARLTVTDNQGATGTKIQNITVQAPTGNVLVTVKDATGINISGAAVTVTVGGAGKSGTTSSNGTVLLMDVLAGSGTVSVTRDTFVPQTAAVTVTANQTANVSVTLDRVTKAVGGVLETRTISTDGTTLEFSIQVVVVNESSNAIAGLQASAFNLLPCTPSAATADADCVVGLATPADAAYTVLGPGSAPSFQEIPGGMAQPYAATLMFDQSKSIIQNDPTDARLYSAKDFLEGLGGSDRVALAAFASDIAASNGTALIPEKPVTIYPVGNPSFTADGVSLFPTLDALAALEAGGTPLYESLCRVMDFAAASAPAGLLKAAVVFTDGKDEPGNTTGFSCKTVDSAVAKSKATGVKIFSVGLFSGDVDGQALAALADGGGGAFLFAEDTTQLITIYGSLGNLLSGSLTTYKLTYRISTAVVGAFQPGRSVRGTVSVNTGTVANPTVNLPFIVRIF